MVIMKGNEMTNENNVPTGGTDLNQDKPLERQIKGTIGGWRPGSGRPKGQPNKINAAQLLQLAQSVSGMTFGEALMRDWHAAPNAELRYKYNQLILNKVIADKHHLEVNEADTLQNRQQAFLKAFEIIGTVAQRQDDGLPPPDTE